MSVNIWLSVLFYTSLLVVCDVKAQEKNKAKLVEVFPLQSAEQGFPLTLLGHIEPVAEYQVTASIDGVLDFISDLDASVKKGEPLFQLDTKLLDIELEKLKIAQAQTELKNKQLLREQERLKELAYHQAVTQKDLDANQDALAANQFERQKCRQQIKEINYKRSKTLYVAPFDAVVTEKKTTQGQFIRPGDKLLTLTHIENKRIKCIVPDEYSRFLTLDTRVTYAGQTYKIQSIAAKPSLKDLGRAVYLEVNDMQTHVSDYNARFTFHLTHPDFYQVPFHSIQIDVNGPYIMRVDTQKKAQRVGVKIINDDRQYYIVTGDVHAHDRVVSRGMRQLQTGDSVDVKGSDTAIAMTANEAQSDS